LPGGTEENHEKSIEMAGVPAEIRTEHFPNMGQEPYRYIYPLVADLSKIHYGFADLIGKTVLVLEFTRKVF
jgi:hypothetical protein